MFKFGDVCYFIVSGSNPIQGKIIAKNGTLYTIKYDDIKGIRLKEHRLFKTLEEAEQKLPKPENGNRSPYDYPH